MKKQINPSIKAHVLWSALVLLALVAICAIPFALAQRNIMKQSVATSMAKRNVMATMSTSQNPPPSSGAVTAGVPAFASDITSVQTCRS
jgi:hypothetical protein